MLNDSEKVQWNCSFLALDPHQFFRLSSKWIDQIKKIKIKLFCHIAVSLFKIIFQEKFRFSITVGLQHLNQSFSNCFNSKCFQISSLIFLLLFKHYQLYQWRLSLKSYEVYYKKFWQRQAFLWYYLSLILLRLDVSSIAMKSYL